MSGLPDAQSAIVDPRKITSYLLSDIHPAGRTKAAFFRRFGFDANSWEALRDALLVHARTGNIVSITDNEFGKKYIIEGLLISPDLRGPRVRAVWFVSRDDQALRLVTACPAEEGAE